MAEAMAEAPTSVNADVPRRFSGKKKTAAETGAAEGSTALISTGARKAAPRKVAAQVPDEVLQDPQIIDAVRALPENYNFEIYKTIWRIRQNKHQTVALQMPEGLLMFACIISDIIEQFTEAETIIMGDVTYGACCVDDFTATSLGADFMVHYAHSCLVPVDNCKIPVMYVFVDIGVDVMHIADTLRANFEPKLKVGLLSTIQFAAALQKVCELLADHFADLSVPQARPLSKGEVLGCTAPSVEGRDALVYIGDGRFHLEAIMIANPTATHYRYDPYEKKLTVEEYDYDAMKRNRLHAVEAARDAQLYGLILGTLGRQGNPALLMRLEAMLAKQKKKYVVVLMSELQAGRLDRFEEVDAWIQIACPRLSIDWGHFFSKPVLNSYEADVVLGASEWLEMYPMDYYAKGGGGWSNYAAPRIKEDELVPC